MPRLYLLVVLLFILSNGLAQDLCNTLPANAVQGAFDVNATSGCSPFTVNITDKSGGTDIKYYYEYQGGGLAEITSTTPSTAANYPYLASTDPIVFTILQVGKKGGKEMYACKNVTVRPNNQPLFSYTICNDNVQINIPKNKTINNYDKYTISWGTTSISIDSTKLPFSDIRVIPPSRTIKIEGFYNTPSLNCPSPPAITIPIYNPITFPNGYDKKDHPNIDVIELVSKTKAILTVKGSYIEDGYLLFMTESGQSYDLSKPKLTKVKPGKVEIILPDSTKTYCFQIKRNVPTCGEEVSAEICTQPLQSATPILKDNILKWLDYPTEMTGIVRNTTFGRYMDRTIKIAFKTNTSSSTINATSLGGNYTDHLIDCKQKVCYRIIVSTSGQLYYHQFQGKSISNEICVDRKNFHPPAISDAFVSVNNANKLEITYSDNSGWALAKELYRIRRNNGGSFQTIDSSSTLHSPPIIDITANPDKQSYCYEINYTDECGSTSFPSPAFCSVFLESKDMKTLNWTTDSPFAGEPVVSKEVTYIEETTGSIQIEHIYANTTTFSHKMNLEPFEEFAKYQIKSTDANGRISYSNSLTIPIEASFYFPTAFSPNNDSQNDMLEIKGKTKRVTSYDLSIFTKWGEKIFHTTNKDATWDGTFRTKELPMGVYTYQLKATTNTNEKINKNGSIWLLR